MNVLVITKKVDPWEQVAFKQPSSRARAVSASDDRRCDRCEEVWEWAQSHQAEWSWDTATINEAVDNYSHLDVCDCAYAEEPQCPYCEAMVLCDGGCGSCAECCENYELSCTSKEES
jgi:hypothetical protein